MMSNHDRSRLEAVKTLMPCPELRQLCQYRATYNMDETELSSSVHRFAHQWFMAMKEAWRHRGKEVLLWLDEDMFINMDLHKNKARTWKQIQERARNEIYVNTHLDDNDVEFLFKKFWLTMLQHLPSYNVELPDNLQLIWKTGRIALTERN